MSKVLTMQSLKVKDLSLEVFTKKPTPKFFFQMRKYIISSLEYAWKLKKKKEKKRKKGDIFMIYLMYVPIP